MNIYNNRIYRAVKKGLKSFPLTAPLVRAISVNRAVKKQLANSVLIHGNVHKYYSAVVNAFDSTGLDYFLCFGTLLGAVREDDFIKHDDDLEFGIFSDQYFSDIADVFQNIGFERKYRYYIDESSFPNEGFVEKYSNGVIHFDLFVYTRSEGRLWCYSYKQEGAGEITAIKLAWKDKGLEKRIFKNHEVNFPSDPESFLASIYGSTWNKPVVYWDDTLASNIEEISSKGRFREFGK